MLKYSVILFDLDGTLIETGPAIFASVKGMMDELGLPPISEESMRSLIGPPLNVGFAEYMGLNGRMLEEAIRIYRLKAEGSALSLARPYPGVEDLLKSLKEAGATVGVVTSKITGIAKQHLERFGLRRWIDLIQGATDGGIGEKTELLMLALKSLGMPDGAVMIGDRHYDLNAARAAGIPAIGVSYGYGSADEIASCAPDYTAASARELGQILFGGK